VSAIRDAIDQRLAESGIRNHLGPFGERKVGGQNNGSYKNTGKSTADVDFIPRRSSC
jgi:hypothetical protein